MNYVLYTKYIIVSIYIYLFILILNKKNIRLLIVTYNVLQFSAAIKCYLVAMLFCEPREFYIDWLSNIILLDIIIINNNNNKIINK